MNLVNFKNLDFGRLTGWLVLVDYEGTVSLPGSEVADEESLNALITLKNKGCDVFICSNRSAIDKRIESAGITRINLSCTKPTVGDELISITANSKKPALLIGDSLHREGCLAKRLKIPFMPVLSLGEKKETPFPASFGCPAPFYDIQSRKICLILEKRNLFDRIFSKESGYKKQLRRYAEELASSLKESGAKVLINPPTHQMEGSAIVIGTRNGIEQAVVAKQKGFLAQVIAGPGICELASEATALLEKSEVDEIVLSSESKKANWEGADPYFGRVKVIGTIAKDIGSRAKNAKADGHVLVFADNVPEKIFKEIMKVLWQKNLSIVVSKNATFKEARYLTLLKNAKAALVLTGEQDLGRMRSQAWMADVPTLSWTNNNQDAVPASCGRSFEGEVDFEYALSDFLSKNDSYSPREYALAHLTPEVVAGEFLRLLTAK